MLFSLNFSVESGIKQTASVIFVGIFVLLVFNTFFSVHETRQAIVLQFGRPVGAPITEPGLKLKMPFIQQVQYLDKRIIFKRKRC